MEEIKEINQSDLPACEKCGEHNWCPSEYLDFYCANCGWQIDIEELL